MAFDENGAGLNARFAVETLPNGLQTVVVFGRWHKSHNRDYVPLLELLLRRLKDLGTILNDALVDTLYTRRHGLDADACRLPPRARAYPIHLSGESDITELRLALLSDIGSVGLASNARGGHTPYKQIRLFVSIPGHPPDASLARALTKGGQAPT